MEFAETLDYAEKTAQVVVQILNMNDPGDKLNTLTGLANKTTDLWEKFNSHDDEAKSYCKKNKGYTVVGDVFKRKVNMADKKITPLRKRLEAITNHEKPNFLNNPDAAKEINRCSKIIASIVGPVGARFNHISTLVQQVTSRGGANTAEAIKSQIMSSKKFEKREGFPIVSITYRQFPSTWHFDENDHSKYVDDIRKKFNSSTIIVRNDDVMAKLDGKATNFIYQHEIGHAKEYNDGTLKGQADIEGEMRADEYAVKATGYTPDDVLKIFDRVYDICKSGFVPRVDLIRLRNIFDKRIENIRKNYKGNVDKNAAFIGLVDSDWDLDFTF
jgi:hypothetical protein